MKSDGAGSLIPATSSNFDNLVRGSVADNKDPLNIGRVRVRIYKFHGTKDDGLSDDSLPWAFPSFPYAAYDAGSFTIPELNTNVWIIFEDGDKQKPVYIGGFYGIGSKSTRQLGQTDGASRHQPAYQKELPKEQINSDVRVVYKSPKGSKIIIDEHDGKESILIESPDPHKYSNSEVVIKRGSKELKLTGDKLIYNGDIEVKGNLLVEGNIKSNDLITTEGSYNDHVEKYDDHVEKYDDHVNKYNKHKHSYVGLEPGSSSSTGTP